jgi:serine/threonine protein kinase
LLIDEKFRLVIVDFGFALKLEEENSTENYFIEKCRLGSEEYNPPELNFEDSGLQMEPSFSQQKEQDEKEMLKLKEQQELKYDGIKADIFSAATTLFLMVMRSAPFRKAQVKDPFFKRLCAADKKPFWNIFKGIPSSQDFKDFFEKLS